MKRHILPALCLIMITASAYATDSVTQEVDKVCSLNFPATPHFTNAQGLKNYLYMTDSCSYLVQVKPMTKEGVVHDTGTLSAFYGGIVKGILRGERGTLIGSKRIDILGLRGEEMEYIKADKDHQPISECSRILLLDGRLIVYSFSAPYGRFVTLKYARDRFFASFSISRDKPVETAKPAAMQASDTTPTPIFDSVVSHLPATADHTELVNRNTLNFIISFAVCILLLAGILYVLIRWKKRK